MSEARQIVRQMEHAEQSGDRQTARAMARTILASGERPIGSGDEASAQMSARELLARTEPDPFLLVVGVLGLGLIAWLVYNYIL